MIYYDFYAEVIEGGPDAFSDHVSDVRLKAILSYLNDYHKGETILTTMDYPEKIVKYLDTLGINYKQYRPHILYSNMRKDPSIWLVDLDPLIMDYEYVFVISTKDLDYFKLSGETKPNIFEVAISFVG